MTLEVMVSQWTVNRFIFRPGGKCAEKYNESVARKIAFEKVRHRLWKMNVQTIQINLKLFDV